MKYISTLLLKNFWLKDASVLTSEFREVLNDSRPKSDSSGKINITNRFFSNEFGEALWASALDRINLKLNLRIIFEDLRSIQGLSDSIGGAGKTSDSKFIWLGRLFLKQQQRVWRNFNYTKHANSANFNFSSILTLRRISLGRTPQLFWLKNSCGPGFSVKSFNFTRLPSIGNYQNEHFGGFFYEKNKFLTWSLADWVPVNALTDVTVLYLSGYFRWRQIVLLTGQRNGYLDFAKTFFLKKRHWLNSRFRLWLSSVNFLLRSHQFCFVLEKLALVFARPRNLWMGLLNHNNFKSLLLSFSFVDSAGITFVLSYLPKYIYNYCVVNFAGVIHGGKITSTFLSLLSWLWRWFNLKLGNILVLRARCSSLNADRLRFSKFFDWIVSFFFLVSISTDKKLANIGPSNFSLLCLSSTIKSKNRFTRVGGRRVSLAFGTNFLDSNYNSALHLLSALPTGYQILGVLPVEEKRKNTIFSCYKEILFRRRVFGSFRYYNLFLLDFFQRNIPLVQIKYSSRVNARLLQLSTCAQSSLRASSMAQLSSVAWLLIKHSDWFANNSKITSPAVNLFSSTSDENLLTAFSSIGSGGLHSDFFFISLSENVDALRPYLGDSPIARNFLIDSLLDVQRTKLVGLAFFDLVSLNLLRASAQKLVPNNLSFSAARLNQRLGLLASFFELPSSSRHFFFNSLDSNIAGCSKFADTFYEAFLFEGGVSAMSRRAMTSWFRRTSMKRRHTSLSRLHFKRKRLRVSAQLYFGYKFSMIFYDF